MSLVLDSLTRGVNFAQSLGLIIPRDQSVSGHVVQAKVWGRDKNLQKWDKSETSYTVVDKTSVSHFMVKNASLKDTDGKEKFKRMLSFLNV